MRGARSAPIVATGVGGLAAVGVAAGTWSLATGPARYTTYAGHSDLGLAMTVLAAGGLAAAGVAAAPRLRWSGLAATVAALVWCAPAYDGWSGGPTVVRSVAAVLPVLLVPAALQLALTQARVGRAWARVIVTLAWVEAIAAMVILALVRDPYLDDSCVANCTVNSFLVHAAPSAANRVGAFDRWWAASVSAVMVVLCLRQLWPVSAAGLRRLAPVPLAMVGFATGVALRAVALHSHGVDDPRDGSLFAAYVVMGASLVALSGAVLDDVARRRGERRALGRIVTELAEAPRAGSLQAALAAALGDPKLRMAYWLPASRCWVDAGGFKVPEPQSDSATVATRLTQGEETVAVVLHAAGLADVGAALGAAARLGIDNERLQADVLAQLHEIRASRSRIVETGDNERRRLERDLHDGAQQRLLALSYDLRLAQSRAATSGEVTVAERLGGAVTETLTALAELRELAGGIYPAALTEVGLVAALQTFAASTPLPVEVTGGIDQRWPGAESAAYFAVADAVDDAQRRGASYVHVTLAGDAARLLVTVTDDGALRQDPGVEVADRVGALGGEVAPVVAGLRMEIPCG